MSANLLSAGHEEIPLQTCSEYWPMTLAWFQNKENIERSTLFDVPLVNDWNKTCTKFYFTERTEEVSCSSGIISNFTKLVC